MSKLKSSNINLLVIFCQYTLLKTLKNKEILVFLNFLLKIDLYYKKIRNGLI